MTRTKCNASHVIAHCVTYKNYDNRDIQNVFLHLFNYKIYQKDHRKFHI